MSDDFDSGSVRFSEIADSIGLESSWLYEPSKGAHNNRPSNSDPSNSCEQALREPLDFPSIMDAVVPGDRVALAVDPNLPEIENVLEGVVKTVQQTDASGIDVVLWDEATDSTIQRLQNALGESASIVKHESSQRDSVRYLGADKVASPVYLNRTLVDADFVLPIVPFRPADGRAGHDLTGIFPSLTDSKTRSRFFEAQAQDKPATLDDESQVAWWLGVQMLLCVKANVGSNACEAFAGTPDAIRKRANAIAKFNHSPAGLVIASLDGNEQQQTWANAVRAIVAASQFTEPGGVIVAWTQISQPPTGALLNLDETDLEEDHPIEIGATDEAEDFGLWDETIALARALASVTGEYRVMVHSRLDREQIEPMGIGVVGDKSELKQLAKSFESCGVIPAAQFVGSSHNKVAGHIAKTNH